MRTIKFRGLYENTMVFGNLIVGEIEGRQFAQIERSDFNDFAQYEVEPETVGQLSPFKDIQDKEIYEGDIVKDIVVGMKSVIVFTDYGNFGIKSLSGLKDLEYDLIDPSWTCTSVEIIGNIHQNPELL